MRIIEFAVEKTPSEFSPCVMLMDCADISGFEQISEDKNRCKLITKTGKEYNVYGTYKTITNRFFYSISKKHNFYEDDTIRPSIRVFHRPQLLEIDTAFFDKIQLKAFIYGLIPDFDSELLPEYTKELFSQPD
jgi:hypothetical protein